MVRKALVALVKTYLYNLKIRVNFFTAEDVRHMNTKLWSTTGVVLSLAGISGFIAATPATADHGRATEKPVAVVQSNESNCDPKLAQMGLVDSNGQPIVDSNGKEVRIDGRSPACGGPPMRMDIPHQRSSNFSITESEGEAGMSEVSEAAPPVTTFDHLHGKSRAEIRTWMENEVFAKGIRP
ncbi:hypothetical protein LY12_002834 [Prauserella alba]|nr:hypothetical protein [Prauserella alba]